MRNDIKSVLVLIVPRLVNTITENMNAAENDALTMLYSSELYERLENDETKLWHLSVPTLYELFREEQATGGITYPEEA